MGAAFSAQAAPVYLRAWQSRRWPTTSGVLEQADIAVLDANYRGGPTINLEAFPRVTYRYTVGGEAYLGVQIRFAPTFARDARRIARRHPPGSPLTVAYDPRRPERSVLEPGPFPMGHLVTAAALGVLAGGLAWLVQSLRT